MKPGKIPEILDLALKARTNGDVFNPLFTGDAGLGKSALVKEWVKKQREQNPDFFFLDLRVAYLESPDLIGFPQEVKDDSGIWRTVHAIPEFWPLDKSMKGLILFEEPNRGTTGVMNCLMQILTDRKIHKVDIPDGVLLAACINPDSAEYDVNHMDAALRNRFEEFVIEFDHLSFMDYIEAQKWHDDVTRFVGSGIWVYKPTHELAEGATYISPRTWEKMNTALVAGIKNDRTMHRLVASAILGRDIGNEFHKFSYDQAPVTAVDLMKDEDAALKRLQEQSQPDAYKGDMIMQTVESIVKAYGGLKKDCKEDEINEDVMVKVAKIIPADQAINLLRGCGMKVSSGQISSFFNKFIERHPDLVDLLRSNIKVERATKKK